MSSESVSKFFDLFAILYCSIDFVCFPLINSRDTLAVTKILLFTMYNSMLILLLIFSYKYYNFHYYQGGPKVIFCDEN